ncbi:hypothetical protein Anas_07619 [Armadillidium nasatum]|uniref:Uncharacterized protein n=1 Tax=Armadillidium nasatum TaxID=96803 RepID=A0A5N5TNZ7_9CRUS|nr:hypothetical protein Anas_07619 [Armadillidium nasatum]
MNASFGFNNSETQQSSSVKIYADIVELYELQKHTTKASYWWTELAELSDLRSTTIVSRSSIVKI